MDCHSLSCRFEVYNEGGVVWSCPATHPQTWTWDYQGEKEALVSYIRKAVKSLERTAMAASEEAQKWASEHEAIMEYMTTEELPEGGSRTTSMLCVFYENGLFKVALQDRQEGLSLWSAAQSIPEAISALETRLRAGDGDWRPMRGQQQQKGRKR